MALIAFGVFALVAALLLGFIILFFLGGGHNDPFGPARASEWVFRVALLAVPSLLLLVGFFSIFSVDGRGIRRIIVSAGLVPVCILIAGLASAHSSSEREQTIDNPCGDLPPTACRTLRPPRG